MSDPVIKASVNPWGDSGSQARLARIAISASTIDSQKLPQIAATRRISNNFHDMPLGPDICIGRNRNCGAINRFHFLRVTNTPQRFSSLDIVRGSLPFAELNRNPIFIIFSP
jgi:hypothetical protein